MFGIDKFLVMCYNGGIKIKKLFQTKYRPAMPRREGNAGLNKQLIDFLK